MASATSLPVNPAHLLKELGWTRRLASSLTDGDSTEAEEIVQDTWVAALRARPDERQPLRPWLRQVAMNLVRGRVRGVRRRSAREQDAVATLTAVATPEELLACAQTHRLLVDLVLELHEPLRVTVLQRYFEGRSAAEIAAMTGTAPGTVRWRLKTALDELRRRLAERYPDQSTLRRALMPVLPVVRWWPRLSAAGVLCLVFITSAAMVVLLAAGAAPPPSIAGASTPSTYAHPGPADDGPHTQRALAACRAAIDRAQPQLAELRTQRHHWTRASRLFREGQPNPRAWVELDPVVRRILAGDEPVFPSYVFECRTWVCKLVMYQDDPRAQPGGMPRPPKLDFKLLAKNRVDPMQVFRQFEPAWNIRIQTDRDFLSRITGSERPPGVPSFDALSLRPVVQNEIYLRLADPSGRPANSKSSFVPLPWGAGAPAPATSEDCAASERALQAEIARLRAEIEPLTPPWKRYQAANPNPALARAFASHVEAAVGLKHLSIDCRGQICRLSGANGVFDLEAVARPVMRKGPLVLRLDRLSSSNDSVLFAVAPGERVDGYALLLERVVEFKAAGHLTDCLTRHPSAGSLRVRLTAPNPNGFTTNDDGDRDRISVRLGGQAGGSSFAACIEEAIHREIVAPGLPAALKGATYDELWTLP